MQQQVTAIETMQAMIKAQEAFRRLSSQSVAMGGGAASLPMQLNTPNAALSLFMAAAAQNSVASMQQAANENMGSNMNLMSVQQQPAPATSTTPSGHEQSLTPNTLNNNTFMQHAGNGGGGGASGRRANRTRFTDYQLKTLQEFFEKQAYPKDDDLEFLSKKMQLSPRVIVVWFQNARQKARKIYENQPNQESNDRFIKTPGCNYQCKRCNLVFQRYYELIQHQRKHCFKDAHWDDTMMIEGDNGGDMTSTSYQQGGLQCDQCSADFPSVQLLEQHAKVSRTLGHQGNFTIKNLTF
jgi:hypothetical protein